MSDEAIAVYDFKTGNKIFCPNPSIGLSTGEICELLAALGLQISPEIYENLSPLLKVHFRDTKPLIIEHSAYKQD